MWKWTAFVVFSTGVSLEVATLLLLGSWLGAGWALAWVAGSSVGGAIMVRVAGFNALIRVHRKLRQQELPTHELLDMALVLLGGLLLILPGLVTDAMGLLLAVPLVRWVVRGSVIWYYGELFPEPVTVVQVRPAQDETIEIRPVR